MGMFAVGFGIEPWPWFTSITVVKSISFMLYIQMLP